MDTNLKVHQKYFCDVGQRVYEEHKRNSQPPMKLTYAYDFVCYAEKQILGDKLSPDAICGEAKLSGRFERIVSTKTIYNYIDKRFEIAFKSVTSDNGSEFVDLGKHLPTSTKVYYAHPYSSYERGTNEKQNSLVRRFFPKGRSFDSVSDEQISFVEHWINNLPRKIFNYRCSDFIFKSVLFDIAI